MRLTITILSAACLCMFSTVSKGQWISDIDRKYAQKNPALYQEVTAARALNDTDQYEMSLKALDLLNSVVQKDPKFAPAYVQLARVFSDLGNQGGNNFDPTALRHMEEYLQKALALEPRYDYALALMGFAKMFQGNFYEAEQYYEKASNMGSKYPFLKAQMAQLATRTGNYEKAIALAVEGYEEHKMEPAVAASIINEIIFAYERLEGDHTAELDKWQTRRRELNPNVPAYWYDHARFKLYFLGDYANAITYIQKGRALTGNKMGEDILGLAEYARWGDSILNPGKYKNIDRKVKSPKEITAETGISAEYAFVESAIGKAEPVTASALLKQGLIKNPDIVPSGLVTPALIGATYSNHPALIKLLLSKGANINAIDKDNKRTAIFYAVEKRNFELVKLLTESGARLNAIDGSGNPLVFFALGPVSGYPILEYLLSHGANPDIPDQNGETLIAHAIRNSDSAAVRLLVNKYHANVDGLMSGGMPMLAMAAIQSGHASKEIVKILLKAGANPWVKYGDDVMRTLWTNNDPLTFPSFKANAELIAAARKIHPKPANFGEEYKSDKH